MFVKPTQEITYKKKKFTVEAFSVSQSINFRSLFRRAEKVNDDVALLELMVEMILAAVIKPTLNKKKLGAMSEDDLFKLFALVSVANGFAPGEANGKAKKKKS